MSLASEIIQNSTEVKDATVSAQGFGTPGLLVGHNYWPELVREFGSLDEIKAAGVPVTSHVYDKALGFFSQQKTVTSLKILKRQNAFTHILTLTMVPGTDGDPCSVRINGADITATQAAGSMATPLLAAIQAVASGYTASAAGEVITLTASTTNTLIAAGSLVGGTIEDTTVDPGIATDFAACLAVDPDFYGVVCDGHSKAQIVALSAAVEAEQMLAMFVSQDSAIYDAQDTTDVASALDLAGLHRSALLYHERPADQCGDARWMGAMLPGDPGSKTWANKRPAGLDRSRLTKGQLNAIKGKHANAYVEIKGLGYTRPGWAASGRYLDIVRGIDWFDVQLAEAILILEANEEVPLTNSGGAMIQAQMEATILRGQAAKLIADDPAPTVTVPDVSEVSQADKLVRHWPGFGYAFTLRGRAQSVAIQGAARI